MDVQTFRMAAFAVQAAVQTPVRMALFPVERGSLRNAREAASRVSAQVREREAARQALLPRPRTEVAGLLRARRALALEER